MGDVRHALRVLAGARGFAATAILILALAIAGNTATFSAVDVLLLQPLPFTDAGRLVVISGRDPTTGARTGISPAAYHAWSRDASALDGTAAVQLEQRFNVSGGPDPIRVTGGRMTASLLPLFGVTPLRGRLLSPADEQPGAPPVVLITDRFWATRFGRADSALGSDLVVDGVRTTVVGVLPPDFRLLYGGYALWAPLAVQAASAESNVRSLIAIARTAPGTGLERCAAELTALARAAEVAPGREPGGWMARVIPMRDFLLAGRGNTLAFVLVALGLLLLVACANVASLQLARAAMRRAEIAMRLAIGASRWQIVRQLLAEAVVLAAAAAVLALALVAGARRVLLASSPDLRELAISPAVLAFALLLAAVTAAAFGLVPALTATRLEPGEVLKSAVPRSRSTRRLLSTLVVLELASSLVLLVPAGLLFKSFLALRQMDPGFSAGGILTFSLALPRARYPGAHQQRQFCLAALEGLAALPGVRAAAAADALPLEAPPMAAVELGTTAGEAGSDGSGGTIRALMRAVSTDYFRMFDIPLRAGRPFGPADAPGAQAVAIVNETLAAAIRPDGHVLGERLRTSTAGAVTIVGVAADLRSVGLRVPPQPEFLVPLSQHPRAELAFAIAADGDRVPPVAPARAMVQALDPDVPLASVRPMTEIVNEQVAAVRLIAALLAALAGMALLLAAVGLSGLMTRLVAQRTPELGIRAALGATRRDLVLLVMGDVVRLVGWGALLGLPAAAAAARLASSAVWGVRAADLQTFAVVTVVLALATLAACYVPVRRASGVDPAAALRAN